MTRFSGVVCFMAILSGASDSAVKVDREARLARLREAMRHSMAAVEAELGKPKPLPDVRVFLRRACVDSSAFRGASAMG
jgi:hypothetical protein